MATNCLFCDKVCEERIPGPSVCRGCKKSLNRIIKDKSGIPKS